MGWFVVPVRYSRFRRVLRQCQYSRQYKPRVIRNPFPIRRSTVICPKAVLEWICRPASYQTSYAQYLIWGSCLWGSLGGIKTLEGSRKVGCFWWRPNQLVQQVHREIVHARLYYQRGIRKPVYVVKNFDDTRRNVLPFFPKTNDKGLSYSLFTFLAFNNKFDKWKEKWTRLKV